MKSSSELQETPKRCMNCRRKLELGVDVICVEEGVIGPRGIVPLKEVLFFCDDGCIASYFGNGEVVTLKRRVP